MSSTSPLVGYHAGLLDSPNVRGPMCIEEFPGGCVMLKTVMASDVMAIGYTGTNPGGKLDRQKYVFGLVDHEKVLVFTSPL